MFIKKINDFIISKQDKRRGELLMNKNKYTQECMLLINKNNFKNLTMTLRQLQKERSRKC